MMKTITSIEELTTLLNLTDKNTIPSIINRINIPKAVFDKYATWNEDDYTRNCIFRTPDYELLLLCWSPGIKTAIHNHGGNQCWVAQINGEISEIRYTKDANGKPIEISRGQLNAGESTYIDDQQAMHRLMNETDQPIMSLHLYAAPITKCAVYDDDKEEFYLKEFETLPLAELVS